MNIIAPLIIKFFCENIKYIFLKIQLNAFKNHPGSLLQLIHKNVNSFAKTKNLKQKQEYDTIVFSVSQAIKSKAAFAYLFTDHLGAPGTQCNVDQSHQRPHHCQGNLGQRAIRATNMIALGLLSRFL